MIYDPKWEKTTKTDPLTLPALIAWLETKPAGRAYCYTDTQHCLAANYYRDIGRDMEVHSLDTFEMPPASASFGYTLEWIACQCNRTYGGALDLARQLAASR